jgi:hypothetical protein
VGGAAPAEALAQPSSASQSPPGLSVAALVFLRGRDADGRLRELAASGAALRPLLGELAAALSGRRLHEALGFRSLGDFGRERLGVNARTLREWARVWRALEALPRLRQAVVSGEVSWTVARKVVGLATPETEAACLETVRGRTVRAVEAIVAAVKAAERPGGAEAGPAGDPPGEQDAEDPEASVPVRIPCTPREAGMWQAAVELARRVSGEALPVWACAEAIAAEAASAWGVPTELAIEAAPAASPGHPGAPRRWPDPAAPPRDASARHEHGLRERAFPRLRWRPVGPAPPAPEVAALARGAATCSAAEIDRRLRVATAFLQHIDLETGRVLGQVQRRALFRELGFESFERYAVERLDLAPRTARRLVALARAEGRAPELASAFRTGEVHAFQAAALLPVAQPDAGRAWVERARAVSLRRLEADVADATGGAAGRAAIAFRAPPEVAALFLALLARAGSLEALLAHAIATWAQHGSRFRDPADFARDGWRCTVPGCTARRNLQSHHIRFRSAGGPDVPSNRTTLCAFHHHRGVHAGRARIAGSAPDALRFELGGERWRSGDVRLGRAGTPGG